VQRRLRPGRRLALLLLTSLATIGVAGSALATTAGTPGRWTVVTRGPDGPAGSASDLGLARTPDGALHVAWKERTGPSTEAIRHLAVSPAGAVGATSTIVAGWTGLSDPELVVDRSGLRVFFGGQHSTSSSDPLAGLLTAPASAAGASWGPLAVVHQRNQVGARNLSATVAPDGTPFQAWYGVSEIYVHRGLTEAEPDRLFTAAPELNEFGPTIVDDASGRLWVSWCAFAQKAGGLYVQRADPRTGAPLVGPLKLPGSTTIHEGAPVSTCNLERTVARRTPMVARAGGGVFVAGAAGYPTLSRVLVWRIDPSGAVPQGSFVVGEDKAFGHSTPVLAAAPDGRIWVAWLELRPGAATIAARRSNRLGTAWGEPVRVRAPGSWLLEALNVSAQGGRLDVLGLMQTVSGDRSVQHTQLLPGLTVRRAATTRSAGKVTIRFRVSDAGDPVAGARVMLSGGRGTVVTGGNGIAAFADPSPGRIRATATKAGYVGATTTIRCC
jgi:hypothetical protein